MLPNLVKLWTLALVAFISTNCAQAQQWISLSYGFDTINNITYGIDTNFAGIATELTMDIAVPVGDTAPLCGRPLMVIVHGGAFLTGTKDDITPQMLMEGFARRGYVTASINYRLGFFNTHHQKHCNVANWDCLNAADTVEWIRACYRGMQDTKGAIRYLVNHAATYSIDPNNVFLVGASAGAIIVLQTTFVDVPSEKPAAAGNESSVPAPNSIYESPCIQKYNLAPDIDSMRLTRPDLGNIDGRLNPTSVTYEIKGVGAFYGGMFNNYFIQTVYHQAPVIYMFHQPNDLLVPYQYDRILEGIAYCATKFPFNCALITDRPYIYGSRGIKDLIDAMPAGPLKPVYVLDTTSNNADCQTQIVNPSTAGHAIDNYALRTNNMAALFATVIDTTSCFTGIEGQSNRPGYILFPNPTTSIVNIQGLRQHETIRLFDLNGQLIRKWMHYGGRTFQIDISAYSRGVYLLEVISPKSGLICRMKLVKY